MMALAAIPVAGTTDPSTWTWTDEERHSTNSDYRERPRVAASGDLAWAVWTDYGADTDVMLRHYNGTAWGNPVIVATEKVEAYQGQIDVAASNGVAHIVWVDARDGDNDIFYRSSGPEGWTPAEELSSDVLATNRMRPSVAADDGVVHVVWMENDGGNWKLVYRSYDGRTLGTPAVLSAGNEKFPRIAADDGKVHVT
jgi:hypothetical protein